MTQCSSLNITLPEYPYDELLVVLLPSGTGELYRVRAANISLGEIRNGWNHWETRSVVQPDIWFKHSSFEDAVRSLIEDRIEAGTLHLTRVETAVSS